MSREVVARRPTDTMTVGTRHNDRGDNGAGRQRIDCELLKESVKNNREANATTEGRGEVYTGRTKESRTGCNHDTNHPGNTWTKS